MTNAHRRRFAVLLVWKVDRFGRSLRHLVNALVDLDAYGIAFFSLRESLDVSSPSGRGAGFLCIGHTFVDVLASDFPIAAVGVVAEFGRQSKAKVVKVPRRDLGTIIHR